MAKVFISYRRVDSATISGRIHDWLVARFGRKDIFKDVDDIPPGANFADYIQASLRQCSALLVIIGPRWLEAGTANGARRLDDASDFVRLEIEESLKLGLMVIPVLVEDARMPSAAELPESLQPLTRINALFVRNDPDFSRDIERLITAVDNALLRRPSSPDPSPPVAAQPTLAQAQPAIQKPPLSVSAYANTVPQSYPSTVVPVPALPQPRPVSHSTPSRRRPYIAITALLVVLVAFGALLAAKLPHGPSASNSGGIVNGKGCKHIGFLLPGGADQTRWETLDHPDVDHALNKYLPGATVDNVDAQGLATTQLTQARDELAKGACILIVGAVDPTAAAAIVTEAKAKNVPVIAYDRLIYSDALSYYVSYDPNSVGAAQGQYIKDHYQQYVAANGNRNLVLIDGSPTDPYSQLFGNGAHSLLDPLIASGSLHKAYEMSTPDWDVAKAQSEMKVALTTTHNQVAVAYVMNDGMASTVIAALRDVNLAGKVLVTGQDATVAGLHNILLGYQAMTVYKPVAKLADAVGKLVAAISKGTGTTTLANQKVKNSDGAAFIPSVLSAAVEVDIGNIKATVIADGYVTAADICQGLPPGTGGVCP